MRDAHGKLVEYAKHNSGAEDAGEWCIWSAERSASFFFFLFFSNPNKKTVLMRFNVIIVGKHLTNEFFLKNLLIYIVFFYNHSRIMHIKFLIPLPFSR